ncbi:hypothetical protein KIN20_035851, partial [Parelaphostrongylus tenuis]
IKTIANEAYKTPEIRRYVIRTRGAHKASISTTGGLTVATFEESLQKLEQGTDTLIQVRHKFTSGHENVGLSNEIEEHDDTQSSQKKPQSKQMHMLQSFALRSMSSNITPSEHSRQQTDGANKSPSNERSNSSKKKNEAKPSTRQKPH